MAEAMIRLEGIHKRFGDLEVLKGIDLEVGKGEVICILGPSGSGKSTLLRCVNLLEPPEEGEIFLEIAALPSFLEMPRWLKNPKYQFGEYRRGLKLQGVKFAQDGSPQGKTAFFTTPYLTRGPGGETNWRGELTFPEETVKRMVKRVYDLGVPLNLHANGDGAIDVFLKAHESAAGLESTLRDHALPFAKQVRQNSLIADGDVAVAVRHLETHGKIVAALHGT